MKLNNALLVDTLLALFVFLPSLVPVPLFVHLLILFFVLPKSIKANYTFGLLILIPFLSFLNQALNFDVFLENNLGIKELVPYSIFMLVSYFFALKVSKRALYFIIYLIVFEVIIGILEYISGVRSFIPSVREVVAGENPFGFNGLLYYSRVSGLSSNSSVFAIKIMASIMMLQFLGPRSKREALFLYGFLGIGLLVTFTRSVFLALALFFFLVNYRSIKGAVFKFLKGRAKWIYFFVIAIAIAGTVFVIGKVEVLVRQINRGMETVDLSSRDSVFQRYSDFFWENPWLGNGSYKLWIEINGKVFHAHNVFMQIVTTNGILIGVLYFFLVFINVNRFNINYILPIIVVSLFQYAIFWGISFVDLFFFSFLLMTQNPNFKKAYAPIREP